MIRAQIELCSQEYNSWNKLVKKTVAVEDKAILQPSYYNRDMDNRGYKGNCLNHTILSKFSANYDNYPKKTQTPQGQKKLTQLPLLGSLRPDDNGSFEKKACKEKKKKYY